MRPLALTALLSLFLLEGSDWKPQTPKFTSMIHRKSTTFSRNILTLQFLTQSHTLDLQDNVALIAVLEALDPPLQEGNVNPRRQLICVANTHIHANPELNDVKLWQVRVSVHGKHPRYLFLQANVTPIANACLKGEVILCFNQELAYVYWPMYTVKTAHASA